MKKECIDLSAVPLTVPLELHEQFMANYCRATRESGRLFLFAADQKIEHLNDDFYGDAIPEQVNDPAHLFTIASRSDIGAFATHLGLVARYGRDYKDISYVIKLNAKTNRYPGEPLSRLLHTIDDVVHFKKSSRLPIVGVGYTVYIGSEYESVMLSEAARVVYQAHLHGLLAILWVYPRGRSVQNEQDPHIIAGAAGVAASLGADFVKVNRPEGADSKQSAELLRQACIAAGKTKVICSGGQRVETQVFLEWLKDQLTISGVAGCAVGRNIFQRSLDEAIEMSNTIAKVVYGKH